MAESGDFDAFFVYAAFSGFAGAEDDEVSVGEIGNASDGCDAEFWPLPRTRKESSGLPGTKLPWVAMWRMRRPLMLSRRDCSVKSWLKSLVPG